MNIRHFIKWLPVGLLSLALVSLAEAATTRQLQIGNIHDGVDAVMAQHCGQGQVHLWYYYDNFVNWNVNRSSYYIMAKDWTDTLGNVQSFKKTATGFCAADEELVTMPVPDENGLTIRKYFRNPPPEITVDGVPLNRKFPLDGEYLASDYPDKAALMGTADRMVESIINTDMGLTIKKRVLQWSVKNHDDYIIYDLTFVNTGNVDLDDEIELNETLHGVYFMRDAVDGAYGTWPRWCSYYGAYPSDSLRIAYSYPNWVTGPTWGLNGTEYDRFGEPDRDVGFIHGPEFTGEAILHADVSTSDHSDDWMNQPHTAGIFSAEDPIVKLKDPVDPQKLYNVMDQGIASVFGYDELTGTRPGHFEKPMELWDLTYGYELGMPYEEPGNAWVVGPYEVAHGDSFRVVFARVVGSISPEVGRQIGQDWLAGNTTAPPNAQLPPPAQEIYNNRPEFTDNDKNKDRWVATGKDSLFNNTSAAQWTVSNNYQVPAAPPAPSVQVTSLPNRIEVAWGDESEQAGDFAGYRVYRALGNPDPLLRQDQFIGAWEPVFACGPGTANPEIVHKYEDTDAVRGEDYYYYVAAFNDGSEADWNGVAKPVESGRYLNMTTQAASLTRPPGERLSEIRVVPNPWNVGAGNVQFQGAQNKIVFYGLPPQCTISIYTQSGDLVEKLEHTDGSGDEAWGTLWQERMTSATGQVVVSGLYIAHVETPEGQSKNVKFIVVR